MGYYTRVSGEIQIDPPITWGELTGSPFLEDSSEWRQVRLAVDIERIETDEGTLTKRSASRIVPSGEDSYKCYEIEDHLRTLVKEFGNGRDFTGRLDGEGEENGDMWRMRVDGDLKVEMIKVEPAWPTWPSDG